MTGRNDFRFRFINYGLAPNEQGRLKLLPQTTIESIRIQKIDGNLRVNATEKNKGQLILDITLDHYFSRQFSVELIE